MKQAQSISLHGVRMTVIKTAPNGVVNNQTVFTFSQNGNAVSAEYAGGRIQKGFLVGTSTGGRLQFTYCQLQTDGKLDCGASTCDLLRSDEGKIRLVEHFEWKSRDGERGENIFEEL